MTFRGKTLRKPHLIQMGITLMTALLLTAAADTAQAGWEDYQPATLSEIIARHASHMKDPTLPEGAPVTTLIPGSDPFRATVIYTGEMRTIGPERKFFIEMWGKASGVDPVMLAGAFEKEIQVQEDDRRYWLPIQNVLIPHLQKEVKKNGWVTLFVVFIGATGEDRVFLVNEFGEQ